MGGAVERESSTRVVRSDEPSRLSPQRQLMMSETSRTVVSRHPLASDRLGSSTTSPRATELATFRSCVRPPPFRTTRRDSLVAVAIASLEAAPETKATPRTVNRSAGTGSHGPGACFLCVRTSPTGSSCQCPMDDAREHGTSQNVGRRPCEEKKSSTVAAALLGRVRCEGRLDPYRERSPPSLMRDWARAAPLWRGRLIATCGVCWPAPQLEIWKCWKETVRSFAVAAPFQANRPAFTLLRLAPTV
jgi:hypothetical protein